MDNVDKQKPMDDPIVKDLAKKYNKNPGQVSHINYLSLSYHIIHSSDGSSVACSLCAACVHKCTVLASLAVLCTEKPPFSMQVKPISSDLPQIKSHISTVKSLSF